MCDPGRVCVCVCRDRIEYDVPSKYIRGGIWEGGKCAFNNSINTNQKY